MRILAVDDDAQFLGSLALLLAEHTVVTCQSGAEGIAALRRTRPELVITDLHMPPPDGFEVLRAACQLAPAPPVIVLTAVNTAQAALEALHLGASDYLVKPVVPSALLSAVAGVQTGKASSESGDSDYGLCGRSESIRLVRQMIPLLARSCEAILVVGETGVGKDLVARAIHANSPRAAGPFIAHNMAATPSELAESVFFGHVRGAFSGATADHAGLFEQADGGTLFLDEIDSFPLALQAKLLRALEDGGFHRVGSGTARRVDVRVIAASETDLRQLVDRGGFRADLLYRLCQIELRLSPLRERVEDIPALAQHFCRELSQGVGQPVRISPEAMDVLLRHSWPGNCRELRHALRSAALMAGGGPVLLVHLPESVRSGGAQRGREVLSLEAVERQHIARVLERAAGNRSLAARLLGIDRGTLARKLGPSVPDKPRG